MDCCISVGKKKKTRVNVRLEFPDWVSVLSLVPRRSVLIPAKNSMLLLFADDTKVYRKILQPNDKLLLQRDQIVWFHGPKNGASGYSLICTK